jgi:hypothetical protein
LLVGLSLTGSISLKFLNEVFVVTQCTTRDEKNTRCCFHQAVANEVGEDKPKGSVEICRLIDNKGADIDREHY